MLMGVHPQKYVENYWNNSEDKPIYPLQRYIGREKFEQVSRFLKINPPNEDISNRFWRKVEPLMTSFRDACQELIILGDVVSIDENLLASNNRSIHLIQIGNKAAGKGYKIYTLTYRSYLYNWTYTSEKNKLPEAKNYVPQSVGYEDDAFTDTERMVLTLTELMFNRYSEGFQFQIAFNHFFSTTRLFEELRHWGIRAYRTAKGRFRHTRCAYCYG
jgi:Transposase IS4